MFKKYLAHKSAVENDPLSLALFGPHPNPSLLSRIPEHFLSNRQYNFASCQPSAYEIFDSRRCHFLIFYVAHAFAAEACLHFRFGILIKEQKLERKFLNVKL
jgi:hypothetical protein